MEKRMVIIGAGIAGLSTGCYALMNGYKTAIFEMHTIPGGLCTAWKRKGYTFDISMHNLLGTKSGPFHQMWKELSALKDQEFFYHDEMGRIESGGKSLGICTDPSQLENQMLSLSPTDALLTKEFIRLLSTKGTMGAISLKPAEMFGPMDKLKVAVLLLPLMGVFRKYGQMTFRSLRNVSGIPFYEAPSGSSWTRPGGRCSDSLWLALRAT